MDIVLAHYIASLIKSDAEKHEVERPDCFYESMVRCIAAEDFDTLGKAVDKIINDYITANEESFYKYVLTLFGEENNNDTETGKAD